MNKGALAVLIHGAAGNWSPERWKACFEDVCRDRPVFLLPRARFDPAEIVYAAVWKPLPGELAGFANLKVIFNLGAGVDALMADSSLPNVPLVRVRGTKTPACCRLTAASRLIGSAKQTSR